MVTLTEKYLVNQYDTDSLWVIISANLSSLAGNESIADYKKQLETNVKSLLVDKGKLSKKIASKPESVNKGLPFYKGFSVLAVQGTVPSIMLKFQVPLVEEARKRTEPLLFIKHQLYRILHSQNKLISILISSLNIKVFYHQRFAMFNLEMDLTAKGKDEALEYFVGVVRSALLHIQTNNYLSRLYEMSRKELNLIYKARETLEASALVNTLAGKISRFGAKDALVATELLRTFDEGLIVEICNYMTNLDNLLVVLTGDFPEGPSSQSSGNSVLQGRPFPKRNLIHPYAVVSNGSILLSMHSNDTQSPYFFSALQKSAIGEIKLDAAFNSKNPYGYDNVLYYTKSTPETVTKIGNNGFVKYSSKFGDRSFIKIEVRTSVSGSITPLQLAKQTAAFAVFVNQRAKWTRHFLEEFHGFLRVTAHSNIVTVEAITGSEHLKEAVIAIEKAFDTSALLVADEEDCKQAIIHKNLAVNSLSFDQATEDALNFIKSGFSNVDRAELTQAYLCSHLTELKLNTKSIFIEGSSTNARTVIESFTSKFSP